LEELRFLPDKATVMIRVQESGERVLLQSLLTGIVDRRPDGSVLLVGDLDLADIDLP
jgi:hypothetical protein